ncbi:MAG: clostripain-related cysteine peptidase [Candidatus Saccharibacteria bacterium]|nr:clostripain-related cysteine peptidase [Candidatus Saccharibacteria bacterium]
MKGRSFKSILPYALILSVGGIIMGLGIFLIVNFCSIRNVSRTVMVYMVGADLESRSGLATEEITGLEHPDKVLDNGIRVIMMAGGSKRWKTDLVSADETSIFELTRDGFKKVKTQDVKNMGEAETLTSFINFATSNYPADDYDLMFWDHGGALLGAEFDELHDSDQLSLVEMKKAFEGTIFGGEQKLESIIFSTCLNGTLEIANITAPFSRYLVASEETSISLPGFSDFSFLEDVTPHDDGDIFGQRYIERYQSKTASLKDRVGFMAQDYDLYSTYSVVDLSRVNKINSAVDEFYGSINTWLNYAEISRVRANLYQYANEQSGDPSYDMVDLYNLTEKLDGFTSVPASKVLTAIEDAVVYNYATNSESRGISIYFPYNASTKVKEYFLSNYADVTPARNYADFIESFNQTLVASSSGGYKSNTFVRSKSNVENKTEGSADVSYELTEEQAQNFAKGRYMVVRSNPDYPGYYWPTYIGKNVWLEGNTLKASVVGRQLTVYDKDEGKSEVITAIESDEDDDYVRYEFAVVLEDFRADKISDWKIDAAKVHMTRDKHTDKVGISDVYLLPKSDKESEEKSIIRATSPVYVSLDDYDIIAFSSSSYNIMNEDKTFNPNYQSNGVIQGWEVHIKDLDLRVQEKFDTEYDYYCMFQVWDIYNNKTTTNFVKIN